MKEYLLIHKESETVLEVLETEEQVRDTLDILDKAGYKDKIHVEEWIIND